jgi:hypothetical protein
VLAKSSVDFHLLDFHSVRAAETKGLAFWEEKCKNLRIKEQFDINVLKADLGDGIEPETDKCQFFDRFWKQWQSDS